MRAYSAYSKSAGSSEGSILVIANTARQAKSLAWYSGECWNVEEWTDLAVKWLRDDLVFALADQDKLVAGIPHVVGDALLVCQACDQWGQDVDGEGMCCQCGGWAGDVLAEVLRRWKEKNK